MLRESEAQMRAVFETAVDGIIILNETGQMESVNTATEQMFGFSDKEILYGPITKVLASADPVVNEADFLQILLHPHSPGPMKEAQGRRKDQSVFPVELSVSEVLLGMRHTYTVIVRDLSERKRLEALVAQSSKMNAVAKLAAGIAHEINNPLGVILGFVQGLLARVASGDKMEHPLKSVERETIRCRDLVQELLTFSRTAQADWELMNLNGVVEKTLLFLGSRLEAGAIEVRKELSENLPRIFGNPQQIEQVLVNMGLNALEAMPGAGVLAIKTGLEQVGQQTSVILSITDTGKGIPPEILPRIFEPFFTTKPIGKGTGLGLSFVYQVLTKHSATIDVKSRQGHTEFLVKFPVIQAHQGFRL
jgi:PAS domain S-box-containing protein